MTKPEMHAALEPVNVAIGAADNQCRIARSFIDQKACTFPESVQSELNACSDELTKIIARLGKLRESIRFAELKESK